MAYFSKGLSLAARWKSVYERELLAIVLAIQKWRHYLLGRHFVIRTDQQSLHHLMDQRVLAPDQLRLVTKLFRYDFEIQYKPGAANRVDDASSRREEADVATFTAISIPQQLDLDALCQEQSRDPHCAAVLANVQFDAGSAPGYSIQNGLLLFKTRLVIPASSPWVLRLLHEFHNSVIGGHSGFLRTYKHFGNGSFLERYEKGNLRLCGTLTRANNARRTPSLQRDC